MRACKTLSVLLIGLLITPLFINTVPLSYAQQQHNRVATKATSKVPAHGNAEAIKATILKDYLYFIASDELEGRDTPSRGLNTAAKFIAMHLSRWGVKPGGDNGSYFQYISLTRDTVAADQTYLEINGRRLAYGEDVLSMDESVADAVISGPMVFVGHGWFHKAKNIDPYQGLDIKDKIVVYAGGIFPKELDNNDFNGTQGVDWDTPTGHAQRLGAKAMIMIPGYRTLANWDYLRREDEVVGKVSVDKFPKNTESLPGLILSIKAANLLMFGERVNATDIFEHGANTTFSSFELSANKRINFAVKFRRQPERTQNVIGIIEGSDPTLKNEYVAIGAHYDHVGIGTPVKGDAIYNGADDDGSGTVAVMALAEAFAQGPAPRRSLLFVWHAGEEHGLWGSRYFGDHPTVPLNQIVTQLNIDMIGRSQKVAIPDESNKNHDLVTDDEIYVIGSKLMSTELGQLSEAVNNSYLNIKFNYKFDDPNDKNRYFTRSDHYIYAVKGIPIIFYFDGTHEDYHRPSDSPDKIDYEKMERVTRTIYLTALELANRAKRPVVDKQIPQEMLK